MTKQIDVKMAALFFGISIIAPFVISNYDVITRLKLGDILEVETAKKEISESKESAIQEIQSEVESQKESIRLLVSTANDTRDEIRKQKEALDSIVEVATGLENRIGDQKQEMIELNESAIQTKTRIEELDVAAAEVALILVRIAYLSAVTKHEFGTQRSKKAIKEILEDLNKILPKVIPDDKERSEWIKELESILPPRP